MEDWELANKLRESKHGIKEVYHAGEYISLDENGKPMLIAWFELNKGDERAEHIYKFVDNKWVLQEGR